MNRRLIPTLILGGLLAAASGCRSPQDAMHGVDGMWAGDSLRAASLQQAILSQATLFPYHFETGTATLNELGRRDIGLLAAHFREHAGALNVRRANASQPLYDARLAEVRRELTAAGVAAGQIALADAGPGGDGMASDRVLNILSLENATVGQLYSGSGTSTTTLTSGP